LTPCPMYFLRGLQIIKIIKADKDRLNHRYELFRKTLAKNPSKYRVLPAIVSAIKLSVS